MCIKNGVSICISICEFYLFLSANINPVILSPWEPFPHTHCKAEVNINRIQTLPLEIIQQSNKVPQKNNDEKNF